MNRRKLSSVHITNYYHKNSGGVSTVLNQLLEEANRLERRASLIVPGEKSHCEQVGNFGRIYYVKAIKAPIFDRRYRLLMPWQYIPGGSSIRNILLDEKPDIIEIAEKYTLTYLAGMINRGRFKPLNRPMLVHLSCERMDDNLRCFVSGAKPIRWFAKTFVGNYIAPMFDFHLANSDYTASEILDAVGDLRNGNNSKPSPNFFWRHFRSSDKDFAKRVFVNNCGVDLQTFDVKRRDSKTRNEILGRLGIPENATVLLYAGRLSPEKNIRLLHDLLRSLVRYRTYDQPGRNYHLLIAGEGPKLDWLKSKLERSVPGHYTFLGHVRDKAGLADIYANADIFVHPNPREPFGISPLEAMASGTPVVAPNSGGVTSYANNENAWVSNTDAESFFSSVIDVLDDPVKRMNRTNAALRTAREFSREHSARRLFGIYDEMYEDFSRDRSYTPEAVPTESVAMLDDTKLVASDL